MIKSISCLNKIIAAFFVLLTLFLFLFVTSPILAHCESGYAGGGLVGEPCDRPYSCTPSGQDGCHTDSLGNYHCHGGDNWDGTDVTNCIQTTEYFIGCGGCGGGGGGSTEANVEGAVTVQETGSYAGPNGEVFVYGGGPTDPLKAYCDANIDVCCDPNGSYCQDSCVRCGDLMPAECGWGFTSYGESGTSSLTVVADSTISPGWISKVKFCGQIQCGSLANDQGTCGEGMCTCLSRGPLFRFGAGFAAGSHTFSIDTSTTADYVPVSMSLSGATSAPVTCDGVSTTCSLTATLNAGGHNLAIVIRKAPKGTITGRVVNQANNAYLKSANFCATGTVLSGLGISSIPTTGGATTSSTVGGNASECNPDPFYSQSLVTGSYGYNVSAVIPIGWEAVNWTCTNSVGGTSCPSPANGAGGTAVIALKLNETPSVNFYVRPIAPSCTISGSSKVSMGSTWWGSATTTVKGLGGAEGVADTEIAIDKSSLTSLGTRIGTTSEPDECSNSSTCNITRFWTPADIDIGNTYNFYCRGNNSTNWVTPLRQCRPYLYGAYPADVDCFNGTKNSTCLGSGTDCIPVEVTDTDAWFQVQGGDTHGQLGITSFIPTTATNPLFNLDLNTYPGLVSYSSPNTYDFSADLLSDGLNYSSSKKWLAQSGFTSNITNFYTHYLDKMKNNIDPSVFDCSGTHNFNNQGIKVYSVTGDCAIGNNWNVSGTSKIVVLVSGNLTLSGNSTTITVDPGSFLSFIVQGNMMVDDNLGNKQLANNPFIQGVYIVNGTITTGTAANMSGNRFIGGGTFYGKSGFNLGRDLKPNGCSGHACNSYTPAELFIFRPDLVVNTPYELWPSKINWQEVVP